MTLEFQKEKKKMKKRTNPSALLIFKESLKFWWWWWKVIYSNYRTQLTFIINKIMHRVNILSLYCQILEFTYWQFSWHSNTRQKQWCHFWPDWPTGTLRVDFTKSWKNSAKIVVVARFRALYWFKTLYALPRPNDLIRKIAHYE